MDSHLINFYRGLDQDSKIQVEAEACVRTLRKWNDKELYEDFQELQGQSWFHLENLDLVVENGKFHVPKSFLSEIPRGTNPDLVRLAKDFIHDYLSAVLDVLKHPAHKTIETEKKMYATSLQDFVVGLVKQRHAGDVDYFQ